MKKAVLAVIAVAVIGGFIFSAKELKHNGDTPQMQEEVTPTSSTMQESAAPEAAPQASEPTSGAEAVPATANAPAGTVTPVAYGNADAPVTIEEYASFTCPHCAHFHKDRLPEMQKQYFDTGKARLEMYSFVRNEQDLRATMLINCLPDNDKRQRFTKALLEAQEQWAFSNDYLNNLRVIAQVGGVGNAEFDACMANKDLETAVIKSREDYMAKRKIESTPFFVIGDQTIKGAQEMSVYGNAIAAATK